MSLRKNNTTHIPTFVLTYFSTPDIKFEIRKIIENLQFLCGRKSNIKKYSNTYRYISSKLTSQLNLSKQKVRKKT